MKILQQHNLKRIGPFVDVLYLTMPLFSIAAYTGSAVTLYVVIMPWLKPLLPWLTLPVYFGFCFVICILAMLGMYKFVYQSYFAFRNNQEYKADSPIRRDLEQIKKDNQQIKEKLGIK